MKTSASSLIAAAISLRVLRVPGAASTRASTAAVIAVPRLVVSASRLVSRAWRALLTDALSAIVSPEKIPRSVTDATLENRFAIVIDLEE